MLFLNAHASFGRRGIIDEKKTPDDQRRIGPDVRITACYLSDDKTRSQLFFIFTLDTNRVLDLQIHGSMNQPFP
mgnify:CR=1 FL=1